MFYKKRFFVRSSLLLLLLLYDCVCVFLLVLCFWAILILEVTQNK